MGIVNTLDLTLQQHQLILVLLQKYLPETTVWAYGSRVKGTARDHSDLDLVVFASPTQQQVIADLKNTFDESNLPFRVDLFAWHEIPESFHKTIATDHTVVQEATGNRLKQPFKDA